MIENQSFIFRPWASMPNPNLELTDTFMQDIKAIPSDCKLTDLDKYRKASNSPCIKSLKLTTDADRLKRMLMNEKSNKHTNGFRKLDRKVLIKKTSPTSSSKDDDQQQAGKLNAQNQTNTSGQTNNKPNSPASSSAETRLINSRIAALSSASHLLNLETYGRLTTPINNQIAAMAAAAVNSTTNPLSLNFVMPNPLPNSLPVPNNLPINNHSSVDNKCLLPEINNLHHSLPNQIISPSVHLLPNVLPSPLPINLPNSLPNSLPSTLPQQNLNRLNNSVAAQQLISNSSLPISAPIQISSTNLSNTIYNEMKSSVFHAQPTVNQQQPGLITPNQHSPQSNTIPMITENSQFHGNALPSSTDVLIANFKKAHTIQLPKKNRPKKFFCNHCPANFANNGQLKGHVRTHTGKN